MTTSGTKIQSCKTASTSLATLKAGPLRSNAIIVSGRDVELSSLPEEYRPVAMARLALARKALALIKRGKSSNARLDELARPLGISGRQLRTLAQRYDTDRRLVSVLPRKRGWTTGKSRLHPKAKEILTAAIETVYLTEEARNPSYVMEWIDAKCWRANIKPPALSTLLAHIAKLDRKHVAKCREGWRAARDKLNAVFEGHPMPSGPFEVVMMDHTVGNIELVDEEDRLPIGRPHITMAVDLYTRAVIAIVISLDKPNAETVGQALHMIATDKTRWLKDREIDAEWPMHSLPGTLSLDNAKEFKGHAIRFGTQRAGVNLYWRQVGSPTKGAIVESIMKLANYRSNQLPGTTKSSVAKKGNYKSRKKAVLTLKEYERILVRDVLNRYHELPHSTVLYSPRRRWEKALEGVDGLPFVPTVPDDPMMMLLDFMPQTEVPITKSGLRWEGITYQHDVVSKIWLTEPKSTHIVKRDPRELTRLHLFRDEPGNPHFLEIPAVSGHFINHTRAERRILLARAKAENEKHVDKERIHASFEKNLEEVDNAKKETVRKRRNREAAKAARKSLERTPVSKRKSGNYKTKPRAKTWTAPPSADFFDPIDDVITTEADALA